jgi:hypothetical protein
MRFVAATIPLRIHPHAAQAFGVVAGILPWQGVGRPRAVAGDGAHLVFGGFCALRPTPDGPSPIIEHGLSNAQIEAAAWAEVKAIWQMMTAPTGVLRALCHDLMNSAPPELLAELGLPLDRDPIRALKRLHLPPATRAEPLRETVFERARARYARSRDA